jgi:peptidoglycan hydrolase-like protein with peptidoglycan-binding domain
VITPLRFPPPASIDEDGKQMSQPTIQEGSQGPVVRWAQYLLVRRTLSYSQIDGVFGPVTKTAVEEFQQSSGLVVDGVVGPATWGALGGDRPEPPTLAQGSSGGVVQKLQTLLNEGRGSFAPAGNPVLVVDGAYGPHTETAVKGVQTEAGIVSDGIVGLQTWAVPVHAAGQVIADLCGVTPPGG